MAKQAWLWDRKDIDSEIKEILKEPGHPRFVYFAALLLERSNEPGVVFSQYIEKIVFCRHWPRIKKRMRKNAWANKRIIFWDAIYRRLYKKFKADGVKFRTHQKEDKGKLCKMIGNMIRKARTERGMTQKEFAGKLQVTQQFVSLLELGRENISINTFERMANVFDAKVGFYFE